MFSYLWETYTTDNIIAEEETEIPNFKPPVGMSVVQYSETLWEIALRCRTVYNELRIKAIFTKHLHPTIPYSMHTYCGANQNATLHDMARHATSSIEVRENSRVLTLST